MSGHLKSSLHELGFVAVEIIQASMIWSSSKKKKKADSYYKNNIRLIKKNKTK